MPSNDNQYRILVLDIENAPNIGYTWGKWEQNVIAFIEPWYMLSFSVRWSTDTKAKCYALPDFPLYATEPKNDRELIAKLLEYLDQADLVIGHNVEKFDIKKLVTRAAKHKMFPASPVKIVDTLKVLRDEMLLNANSLEDACDFFDIGHKTKHPGFEMWKGCMEGEDKHWKLMRKYNNHDVDLNWQLYMRIRPWIKSHPNINLKGSPHQELCPNCGSGRVQLRGWRYLKTMRYRQFACLDCGARPRSLKGERVPGLLLV
jgi:DNA polymerase elongation subunit (family B)